MVQEELCAALNAVEADEFASNPVDIPPATPSDSFVVSEPEDLLPFGQSRNTSTFGFD